MIWRTKQPVPDPELGTRRERIIFALWRRKCADGFTRWLENVRVVEEFKEWNSYGPESRFPCTVRGWRTIKYDAP